MCLGQLQYVGAGRGQLTASFENLSRALGAIRQRKGDNLVEAGEFDLSIERVSVLSWRAGASVAAYVVENDQRTVHAADRVVPYPWLDGHHAGVEAGHVGGGDERFGEGCVAQGRVVGGRKWRWSSRSWVTKLGVVGGKLARSQLGHEVSAA